MNDRSNAKCWVGFDLGGTKMLTQVFDNSFYPLSRRRNRTKGHRGAEQGVEQIVELIRAALGDLDISPQEIGGIGVGCPGPLDLEQGVILEAPNLGWTNVAIGSQLQAEFGCPALIINDVDAGVYGEYCFGAGRDQRCVIGVFPGTGIGGGCVYDGEVIRGRTGSCMEIGHIRVVADGPLCGCGRRGCLEAVASRLAIAAAAAQAAYRGEAPHLMSEIGTDLANIRSKVLANAVKEGDTQVERIIRNAARYIGTAVATLVNLLAPDRVILGGGLVEAMPDLIVPTVGKRAQERVMPAFQDSFDVVAAQLGDDSTVMGAAAWAKRRVEARAKS